MTYMKTMAASTFKAHCLAVVDEVHKTGEQVVITKHGKPVAKLVPLKRSADSIFGDLAGTVRILGDIESPAAAPEDWNAS